MSPDPLYSLLCRLSRFLPAPDPGALSPYQLAEDSALLVPIATATAGADTLPGFRRSRLTEALALAGFVPRRQDCYGRLVSRYAVGVSGAIEQKIE
jgi:hypothetical protein